MKNFYQVLGIENFSSIEVVKARFIFLTHAYHPDKFPDLNYKNEAQEEFIKIKEAFDNLGNEKRKNEYDFRLREEISFIKNKSYSDFSRPDYKKYSTSENREYRRDYNGNRDSKGKGEGSFGNNLFRISIAFCLLYFLIIVFSNLASQSESLNAITPTKSKISTIMPTATISILREKSNALLTAKNFSNYLQEGDERSKNYLDNSSDNIFEMVDTIDTTIHDIKKWGNYLRIYDLGIEEFTYPYAIVSGYLENRGVVWLKYYYKLYLFNNGSQWKVYSIFIEKT